MSKTYPTYLNFLVILIFFSRILDFIVLPSFINLIFLPIVFSYFFFQFINNKDQTFTIEIFIFIIIVFISSLINKVSIFNSFSYLLILLPPFIFFDILKDNKYNLGSTVNILLLAIILNIIFSYYQFFSSSNPDDVKGLLLNQGAGHHINGILSILFCYFLIFFYKKNLLALLLVPLLLPIVLMSDSKQVILALIISIILLFFFNLYSLFFYRNKKYYLGNFLFSTLLIFLIFLIFYLLIKLNIPLGKLNNGLLYFVDGFTLKFQFFNIINEFNHNAIFGHGPGMTGSKLAQMANLIERYNILLSKINFTFSEITQIIRNFELSNIHTNPAKGSSLFQLTFTFGGIYGDLGLTGLLMYLLMLIKLVKKLTYDFNSKILLVSIFPFGIIFTWLEELVFMNSIILILFLIKKNNEEKI